MEKSRREIEARLRRDTYYERRPDRMRYWKGRIDEADPYLRFSHTSFAASVKKEKGRFKVRFRILPYCFASCRRVTSTLFFLSQALNSACRLLHHLASTTSVRFGLELELRWLQTSRLPQCIRNGYGRIRVLLSENQRAFNQIVEFKSWSAQFLHLFTSEHLTTSI